MGLLSDAEAEVNAAGVATRAEIEADAGFPEATGSIADMSREVTVSIAGEEHELERPDTTQPREHGSWLTGDNLYGVPRGWDAIEWREIVQTSAMQSIVNGIADQLLGGEIVFEPNEEVWEDLSESQRQAANELKDVLRAVIEGPHLQNEDFDDLVAAAVEDMLGPGNAYWQFLRPKTGDLPVAALTTLDPLTVRHNVDEHGFFSEPPYWQARQAFSSGTVATLGEVEPTPLQSDQLAVMRYPKGNRSHKLYPVGAAWQVKEWLEILANSTLHHNRFYADNEIPPGLLQVVGGSSGTVETIKNQIKEASGDPRKAPVVGGEGAAQWIELGGTAVNLNVIEEQRWFYELCLGALGLGKAEVGMIEDVNRSNGEIEATRVYKRVTGPFAQQFEGALYHLCQQFDAYHQLGEPFTPKLVFSDPREERAREERLRSMYQAGGLSLREYVRRRGDDDLASDEDRYTVEIGGERVSYGDHPRWVAERLVAAATNTDMDVGQPEEDGE